ncbi:hypothetical protein SDC9_60376 [bioreactor metagenome]|uniref:Uncharacterized protein n=1 Tax=bioreactor metagenome TaxID=1076179 RepID=A0A644XCR2_9ZZZZ
MRLAEVNQRQHHENEGLQGDDQDVEDRPDRTRNDVPHGEQHTRERHSGCATHQGNQHEHQLTSVHVAEQSHAMRHGLGNVFNDLHEQIHNAQDQGEDGILAGAERRRHQFMRPAAHALDLDAVEEAQDQHGRRQAQRGGQVSGRNDAQVSVVVARGTLPEHRQQVNGQQVHGVHHEDPDEHGQRQRGDELARLRVVNIGLGLVVHHLDQHLHGRLETTRHAGGRLAGGQPQHEQGERAKDHADRHGVKIHHREVDDGLLLDVLKVLQVVNDVFTCGWCIRVCGHRTTLLSINQSVSRT